MKPSSSHKGENALLGIPLSSAQMDEYRCACCKVPCASCEENFALEDLQDLFKGYERHLFHVSIIYCIYDTYIYLYIIYYILYDICYVLYHHTTYVFRQFLRPQDPSSASSAASGRMAELTDPSKASQLFSSGSANAMSFGPESIFGATWALSHSETWPESRGFQWISRVFGCFLKVFHRF